MSDFETLRMALLTSDRKQGQAWTQSLRRLRGFPVFYQDLAELVGAQEAFDIVFIDGNAWSQLPSMIERWVGVRLWVVVGAGEISFDLKHGKVLRWRDDSFNTDEEYVSLLNFLAEDYAHQVRRKHTEEALSLKPEVQTLTKQVLEFSQTVEKNFLAFVKNYQENPTEARLQKFLTDSLEQCFEEVFLFSFRGLTIGQNLDLENSEVESEMKRANIPPFKFGHLDKENHSEILNQFRLHTRSHLGVKTLCLSIGDDQFVVIVLGTETEMTGHFESLIQALIDSTIDRALNFLEEPSNQSGEINDSTIPFLAYWEFMDRLASEFRAGSAMNTQTGDIDRGGVSVVEIDLKNLVSIVESLSRKDKNNFSYSALYEGFLQSLADQTPRGTQFCLQSSESILVLVPEETFDRSLLAIKLVSKKYEFWKHFPESVILPSDFRPTAERILFEKGRFIRPEWDKPIHWNQAKADIGISHSRQS